MLVHDGLRSRGYLEHKGIPEKRPIGTLQDKTEMERRWDAERLEQAKEKAFSQLSEDGKDEAVRQWTDQNPHQVDQTIQDQMNGLDPGDLELLKKLRKLKALEEAGIIFKSDWQILSTWKSNNSNV